MKISTPPSTVQRVLLLGATFNTDNMGVGALASGALTILSHRYPNAEISFLDYGRAPAVSTVIVEGRTRQVPLLNLRFSWKLFLPNNIAVLLVLALIARLLPSPLSRRLLDSNSWLRGIREADVAVAVSGGDSFSDIYGLGRFFYVYLPQLLVVSLGTKLVLMPQTIGPFDGRLARGLSSSLMRRAELVYSRDHPGLRQVRDLLGDSAGSRVRFCYDMGFILQPRPPAHATLAMLSEINRSGRLLVGLNVSGLLMIGGYDGNNSFALKSDYRTFTEQLIEFLIQVKGADVLLIPHVFGTQTESDTSACNAVFASLKDRHTGHLFCLEGSFDQNEIKYAIGKCQFFIGARMHACIAALSQAIPAVGIAYSRKFLGVFETVGAEALVADPRTMTPDQMLQLISDAMDQREDLHNRLASTMTQVRRELLSSMDSIA